MRLFFTASEAKEILGGKYVSTGKIEEPSQIVIPNLSGLG